MGKKGSRTINGPRLCQTCVFEKSHDGFRQALLQCNYFNVNSLDSIIDVMWKFQCPLKVINVQRHCKNHLRPMVEKSVTAKVAQALTLGKTMATEVLQGTVVESTGNLHEEVLDATIKKYYTELKADHIKITADIGLKAIKIKSDIEKANKDRKLDALKAFSGMSGGNPNKQAIPSSATHS
jgi:hypothetical protein